MFVWLTVELLDFIDLWCITYRIIMYASSNKGNQDQIEWKRKLPRYYWILPAFSKFPLHEKHSFLLSEQFSVVWLFDIKYSHRYFICVTKLSWLSIFQSYGNVSSIHYCKWINYVLTTGKSLSYIKCPYMMLHIILTKCSFVPNKKPIQFEHTTGTTTTYILILCCSCFFSLLKTQ